MGEPWEPWKLHTQHGVGVFHHEGPRWSLTATSISNRYCGTHIVHYTRLSLANSFLSTATDTRCFYGGRILCGRHWISNQNLFLLSKNKRTLLFSFCVSLFVFSFFFRRKIDTKWKEECHIVLFIVIFQICCIILCLRTWILFVRVRILKFCV